MMRSANVEISLDSDNLEDLDVLFHIVRSYVQNLVVLLTSEAPKQIWSTGEITTAISNGLDSPIPFLDRPCSRYSGLYSQVPIE